VKVGLVMPKENIRTELHTAVIGWNKDTGDVQLGIEVKKGLEFSFNYNQLHAEEHDLDIEDFKDTPYTGLYVDLSRDDINYIIKLLRKVRDQLYVPDEN